LILWVQRGVAATKGHGSLQAADTHWKFRIAKEEVMRRTIVLTVMVLFLPSSVLEFLAKQQGNQQCDV
jgi:hypothetical protein